MGLFITRPPPETVIVVPRTKFLAAAKALAECGCFHPSGRGDERLRSLARRLRGEIESLISRAETLAEKIRVEPSDMGKVETKVVVTSNIVASFSSVMINASMLVEEIESTLGGLIEERGIGSLEEYVKMIRSYDFLASVDLDKLLRSKYLRVRIYRVPDEAVESFEYAIKSVPYCCMKSFKVEEGFTTYAIIYSPQIESRLIEAVAKTGASPVILPKVKLSEEQVRGFTEGLSEALKKLRALSTLLKIIESAYLTRSLAVFVGYVSEDNLEKLNECLNTAVGGLYTVYSRPIGRQELVEELPVDVRVPKRLKAFAELITMYGLPSPRDFMPLLLVAITFPIIFGLMFPDVGHGLLLLLAGLYLSARASSESWRTIGQLLTYVSIPAIVLGFMAAEFFGPATPMAHWIEEFWHGHPPYSSPVHALYKAQVGAGESGTLIGLLTFKTFFLSLLIGSVLLALASWLGLAKAVLREREPERLLYSLAVALAFTGVLVTFVGSALVGPGYTSIQDTLPVIYAMFGGSAPAEAYTYASIAKALILLGLFFSLLTPLLYGHGSFTERIIEAVMEAFDLALAMLGNTLSFVRVMGLMLAHSGLIYGFYVIAERAGGLGTATGLGIYIFGNLFVAGFEAFIANIQALRLHFYEMFSKFYEGRGIRYQPVKLPEGVKIEVVE